jgi:hypothetical protein
MSQAISQFKFAVCISSKSCDDLQVWKLYRVLPDSSAMMEDHLRIIDDSGEDYLYPASRFVRVDFPEGIEQKLMSAASVTT